MVAKLNPALITDDMMYEQMGEAMGIVPTKPSLLEQVKEDKLWGEIRRAAETNTALQTALNHAIMIYNISKEYKDGI